MISRSDPWFYGGKKTMYRRLRALATIVVVIVIVWIVVAVANAWSQAKPLPQYQGQPLSDPQIEWCNNNLGTVRYYAYNNGVSYTTASTTDFNFVRACQGAYRQSNP